MVSAEINCWERTQLDRRTRERENERRREGEKERRRSQRDIVERHTSDSGLASLGAW
jgi:hypothetical protein